MKNRVLSLSLALAMMGGTAGIAHADLLTYFNFEDSTPATTTPAQGSGTVNFVSDAPGLQTSTITSNFTNQNNNTANNSLGSFTGTTVNAASGNTQGTNQALALIGNGNNGNYFQFSFSATGQTNIGLSYATQGTASGFKTQTIEYSLDGTNFNSFAVNSSVPTSFSTFSTGPFAALDNAANVTLRFTLTGATAAGGNNRFDNIQVNSNVMATPEPETWAMMALGLGALAMFSWKRKRGAEEASFGGGFAI